MRSIFVRGIVAPLITTLVVFAGKVEACQSETVGDDTEKAVVQESKSRRIAVLGVTRGIAFLESAKPISDGERTAGSHPVEWLRVTLRVTMLKEADSIGTYSWELSTPQGDPLATKTAEFNPSSSTEESGLKYLRLPGLLYPVAVPVGDTKLIDHVLMLGESGELQDVTHAHLKISFLPTEGEKRETFRFVLPLP